MGIAGRTGCGKSTLVAALFRMVEPSGGSISIDGIDTASIGLFDLRSRMALVPQVCGAIMCGDISLSQSLGLQNLGVGVVAKMSNSQV